VPLNRPSVGFGEATACDEPHHIRLVEQQNRRSLAAQCPCNGVERSVMDLFGRCALLQPFRKRKQRILLFHTPGKLQLGALAVSVMSCCTRTT
jgi:hypothetical protein